MDKKALSFETRAAKWEEEMKPLCEKWGVTPSAALHPTPTALKAVPCLADLWPSSEESKTSGNLVK